jgi:hypothetical protein
MDLLWRRKPLVVGRSFFLALLKSWRAARRKLAGVSSERRGVSPPVHFQRAATTAEGKAAAARNKPTQPAGLRRAAREKRSFQQGTFSSVRLFSLSAQGLPVNSRYSARFAPIITI